MVFENFKYENILHPLKTDSESITFMSDSINKNDIWKTISSQEYNFKIIDIYYFLYSLWSWVGVIKLSKVE